MIHLDQVSSRAFRMMKQTADQTIQNMIDELKDSDMCPVCICHLIAEAAQAAAKRLKDNETTTH